MIVRDEAELMPTFLECAAGLWDELIVVDTGSIDDTVSIAKLAGAKVIHHTWQEDFAEARNVGLRAASSDWILVLDADEFISQELKAQIRDVLNHPQVGAATIQLKSLLPHGHAHESPLIRLFRRDPEIQFRFAIHEEIASSLERYLTRTGGELVTLSGTVDHHGYVRKRAAGRSKKERDLRILERCLSEAPRDLYSQFKRLELARYWDDAALWSTAAAEAKAVLLDAPDPSLSQMTYGGELITLIAQGLDLPEGGALDFATRYRDRVAPSAELHYYIGQQLEIVRRLDEAAVEFRAALEIKTARNRQMATVRPHMGLCRVAMATGDRQSALEHCEQALRHAPRDPEALLALGIVKFAEGGSDAALEAVQAHAERYGSSTELWMALGNAAMMHKDAQTAIKGYRRAAIESQACRPLLHLGKAEVLSGNWQQARRTLAGLSQEIPEAGIGTLVCDMCMDRDSELHLELQPSEADLMLREWLTTALLGADDHALRNIAKRAPSVQHIFPWLPEALGLAA